MLNPIFKAPIVREKEIQSIVSDVRKNNKKIVFTNGCFDILHPGHIKLLEQAKIQGDFLVVAVNTDESVKRLKGLTRPIQPLSSRVDLLASLRVVDCVVSFSQDTPYELIKMILPDVLVKGGDYTIQQIVGADLVLQNGGKVKVVPLVSGFSTTSIIARYQS